MQLPLCMIPQNLVIHSHRNFTYFSAEYVNPLKPSLHLKDKTNRFLYNGCWQYKALQIKYHIEGLQRNISFSLTKSSTFAATLWLSLIPSCHHSLGTSLKQRTQHQMPVLLFFIQTNSGETFKGW